MRTPRKAPSSTCLPNPIRPRPSGRHSPPTPVRTAGRPRPSKRSGDVGKRRCRARGHLRRRNLSRSRSVSPHPSRNSLGSHRNKSARPRRRRRRIGSPLPRRDSGYPWEHREATGCRLPCRIRRLSRLLPIRRLSRPCRHHPPTAAATRQRRTPSIRDAHRRRPLWPPNPGIPRHTPSPRRRSNRSRRRGDTAARRTPAGSRLPTCWRGFEPPRREAAVAGAARSELGSKRPSGTRSAGPERRNL